MAQVQTQVSLKNNGNFSYITTPPAYSVTPTTNNNIFSSLSIGTGIYNVYPSITQGNVTGPVNNSAYGLLFVSPYTYATSGNILYQYTTSATPPGLTYVQQWDVTTFTGANLYLNSSIPGYATTTNNYNTTSLPITVNSTNSITASDTGITSYTVTSVFGTNTFLATDGTNMFALCPDSRIINISTVTAPSTISVVTTDPILDSLTTNAAYGLACTPSTPFGTPYLYVFEGSTNVLKQIISTSTTSGPYTNLTGVGTGSNTYAGQVYYPRGSVIASYYSQTDNLNYLFIGSYSGTNYYAIDALQLTKNIVPPQVAFKYSTVSNFQEQIINLTEYGGILYTLSYGVYSGAFNQESTYNAYQLSITISGAPICFLKGTYIYTNKGYELIETLKKGDLVNTFKDNYVAIDTIVEEEIIHDATQERNKCQLFKLDYPEYPQLLKELYITGAHSILVGKLTEKQKAQIIKDYGKVFATDLFDRLPAYLDERAKVHDESGKYTIYHLALENENIFSNYGIFANGLLVESLSKNDCVNRLF